MYQLYSLLLTLGFIVLLPRFLFDALRHGKYVAGFRERLGFLSVTPSSKPVIWLHCVSVGETQAARPLADLLRQEFPQFELVVSTITMTGQSLAREVLRDKASKVFYFPFDWRWSVRRTLRAINPAAVLLMETELWPNFLHECARIGIPVALVNGRISAKSERRYRMVQGFLRKVIADLNIAIMQDDADSERLQKLGLSTTKLFVCGSLKFDAGRMLPASQLTETFRQRFGLSDDDALILAASTHAPEEQILLECFQILRRKSTNLRMMLAPRHPERFNEVASLIQSTTLTWTRRSGAENDSERRADVILLDTIGELRSVYALASIVLVGGSIARTGGHNILEPAVYGKPIVFGPSMQNFAEIAETFVSNGAAVQVRSARELEDTMVSLMTDPVTRARLGAAARALVEANRGAKDKTLAAIANVLPPSGPRAAVVRPFRPVH